MLSYTIRSANQSPTLSKPLDSRRASRHYPSMTQSFPPTGPLYLIDGSGFIFRAFHALPPLTRPDGTPVGAVLGFVNMLLRLMGGRDTDHIAVIFDKSEQTFRKELYADYKAHRPDPPPEILPQFPLVREATRA